MATRSEVLLAAPKILQAAFAALTDYGTYLLGRRVYGDQPGAVSATIVLTALSPWNAFVSVRTLSNSLETTLTVLALYRWPWDWFWSHADRERPSSTPDVLSDDALTRPELYPSLAAAALACILRPTNLIIWATITLSLLLRRGTWKQALQLARTAVVTGSAVLALSIGSDRIYYGSWVFPPLRFLYFNVVQSLSAFYGQNRPDYYITEGLPLLLTTALPFAGIGIWNAIRPPVSRKPTQPHDICFTLTLAIAATVSTLSLISHKEVRFIYPLLPMLHILSAPPLATFLARPPTTTKKFLLTTLLLANLSLASYALFIHQRGVIDVLHHLRHTHEASPPSSSSSVAFLMPCHSTPWRSHLVHPDLHAWALSCEPPLHLPPAQHGSYVDESSAFYASPRAWLALNMQTSTDPVLQAGATTRTPWPQRLVFFAHLRPAIADLLATHGYVPCGRFFNSHWHDDARRRGDVEVWCLGA